MSSLCIHLGETPSHTGWAETPRTDRGGGGDAVSDTPTPFGKRRSRWDETPASQRAGGATPSIGTTPSFTPSAGAATPNFGAPTPAGTWSQLM